MKKLGLEEAGYLQQITGFIRDTVDRNKQDLQTKEGVNTQFSRQQLSNLASTDRLLNMKEIPFTSRPMMFSEHGKILIKDVDPNSYPVIIKEHVTGSRFILFCSPIEDIDGGFNESHEQILRRMPIGIYSLSVIHNEKGAYNDNQNQAFGFISDIGNFRKEVAPFNDFVEKREVSVKSSKSYDLLINSEDNSFSVIPSDDSDKLQLKQFAQVDLTPTSPNAEATLLYIDSIIRKGFTDYCNSP
ncbi:MAG: hypothetical protein HRT47_12265 [Candidatus Caenarcaniphilales bacterium]|nr:hypothetical protein [Candidatus Caenarcaniphilales bacterium]